MSDQLTLFTESKATGNRCFIALDLEATGFNPETEKVIELGIVKFDDSGIIDTYQTFINPDKAIPDEIIHLTGIEDKDVENAPHLLDVKNEIKNFIGDLPIVGHFIEFDINFLNYHGLEITNKQLDSCELARILLPNEESYNLGILGHKFKIKHENAHRAVDDSIACVELLRILQKEIKNLPKNISDEIHKILSKGDCSWKEEFLFWQSHANQNSNQEIDSSPQNNEEITNSNFKIFNAYSSISSEENLLLAPNYYFHFQKFLDFSDKEELDTDEINFSIKIWIWLLQNQNHENKTLLNKLDIKLHQKEKNLWYRICHNQESFFQTQYWKHLSEEDAINASHEFIYEIIKNSTDKIIHCDELIIHDPPEFANNLLNTLTKTITLSRLQSHVSNSSVKDNLTMLFGMMGIFVEAEFPGNRYENEINPMHLQSPYWRKVIGLCEQLIKENPNNDKLTNDLRLLSTIDFKKNLYTINYTNHSILVWKIYTKNIQEELNNLDKSFEKVYFDSPYQISPNELNYLNIIVPKGEILSPSSKTEACIQIIKTSDITEETEVSIAKQLLDKVNDIIIISNSETNNKNSFQNLFNNLDKEKYLILMQNQSGSLGKIVNIWNEENQKKRILICKFHFLPYLDKALDLKPSSLIINKIPFESLKAPINKIWGNKMRNPFIDFAVPRTSLKIKKAIYDYFYFATENQNIYCLDNRLTAYDHALTNNLEPNFEIKIASLDLE